MGVTPGFADVGVVPGVDAVPGFGVAPECGVDDRSGVDVALAMAPPEPEDACPESELASDWESL